MSKNLCLHKKFRTLLELKMELVNILIPLA